MHFTFPVSILQYFWLGFVWLYCYAICVEIDLVVVYLLNNFSIKVILYLVVANDFLSLSNFYFEIQKTQVFTVLLKKKHLDIQTIWCDIFTKSWEKMCDVNLNSLWLFSRALLKNKEI